MWRDVLSEHTEMAYKVLSVYTSVFVKSSKRSLTQGRLKVSGPKGVYCVTLVTQCGALTRIKSHCWGRIS